MNEIIRIVQCAVVSDETGFNMAVDLITLMLE